MCAVLDSWDQSRARRGRIPSLGCLASDLLTPHGASLKVWWPYCLFLSYRWETCAILLLCSQTFLQPLCPAPCRGIFPWNFSLSLWCWATTAGMSVIDQPLSWNTWSTVRSKALCSLNFLHLRHRFYEGGWGGMGWGGIMTVLMIWDSLKETSNIDSSLTTPPLGYEGCDSGLTVNSQLIYTTKWKKESWYIYLLFSWSYNSTRHQTPWFLSLQL